MPDDHDMLREFSWRRLFPWLILHRALRTSLAPQLLLLASIGCLLNPIGWNVATLLFHYDQPAVVESDSEAEATGTTRQAVEKKPAADPAVDSGPAKQKAGTSMREILQGRFSSEKNEEIETEDGPDADDMDADFPDVDPPEEDIADEDVPGDQAGDSLYSQLANFPGSTRAKLEFGGRSAITGVFRRVVAPFQRFFLEPSWSDCLVLITGTLWTLLVWGLFGGAITRIAVVRLGCDEAVPMRSALKYASARLGTYVLSPLFPMLIIFVLTIPLALLGLLLMWFDFGVLLVSVVWIFVLLAGLAMTYFLLGTLFGWPLMWVVTSAEETGDHYEAFSRSFSYVSQRPFHYLFYALVAVVLGTLGWLLVQIVAELTIHMSYWSVMWGCGADRIETLKTVGADANAGLRTGRSLMDLSEGTVRLVAGAFAYSFFWCGAVGIYLLLRKAVDQTEFDEVFLDDEQPPFDLPALTEGPSVVPAMVENSESGAEEESPSEADTADPPAEESATTDESSPADDDAASDKKSGDDDPDDDHDQELMF
ncbi:MAG: hypothetical protein VB912_06785 [Pirellulaceae bacterium]